MQLARYVVDSVVVEGKSLRQVASDHGVSKSWVGELVRRYRKGGYDALAKRSRRPHGSPSQISDEVEDQVVMLRKQLGDKGLDCGAHTIHYHLCRRMKAPPSISTIWRVLKRRGFVTPQPQKRPRGSYIRFEAKLPNECWQSDVTFWKLACGSKVEICNFIDDHSRVVVASQVFSTTTAADALTTFRKAAARWGHPASVLTDNGCIYTAAHRNGRGAMETELLNLGIVFKHSRPNHPQTCGKVERFHQTLKRYLSKQEPAGTIEQLQAQIDGFIDYYNNQRPHRAKGRSTPMEAYETRAKARPAGAPHFDAKQMRVRHDKVDGDGKVTLRYGGKLFHIGVGRRFKRKRILMLVAKKEVKVLTPEGELIGETIIDQKRNYQPLKKASSG